MNTRNLIKIGGSALNSRERARKLLSYIRNFLVPGEVVLVHGGGELITRWLENFNIETTFIAGQRVTDENSIKVVEMVLSGLVNKELVSLMAEQKLNAVGMSGRDGFLATARIVNECLGLVGEVESVRSEILDCLLENGCIPVLSPICEGSRGTPINVNADFFAAEIAVAMGCESLIFITSTGGVIKDKAVIENMSIEQVSRFIRDGIVTAGMIPKLQSAAIARAGGVKNVSFMDYEGNIGTKIV